MKRTTARAAPVLVSLRGPPDPNAGQRPAEGLAQELDTTTTLLHRSRRDRHSMDELAPDRPGRSMGLSEGRRVADPEHPWRTTIITSAPRTVSVRPTATGDHWLPVAAGTDGLRERIVQRAPRPTVRCVRSSFRLRDGSGAVQRSTRQVARREPRRMSRKVAGLALPRPVVAIVDLGTTHYFVVQTSSACVRGVDDGGNQDGRRRHRCEAR